MSKLNITCEEFARFQSHDWEGLIVKAAEAALALDVENERLRADAEERTKLTGDALQAEGECAALRAENACLTAALVAHRVALESAMLRMAHGSDCPSWSATCGADCLCGMLSEREHYRAVIADPTGTEAAARVQALVDAVDEAISALRYATEPGVNRCETLRHGNVLRAGNALIAALARWWGTR